MHSDLLELSSLLIVGEPFRTEKEQLHSELALVRSSGIADGTIEKVEVSLAELLSKIEAQIEKNRGDFKLWEQAVHHFLGFALTVNLVICIIMVLHLSQNVSKRLRTIMANSDRFAQEKELLPPVEGNDEIGELDKMFRVMADSIESARKRERQFLGMVSHDLRTPLNTVLATLNSLEAGLYGSLNETGMKRIVQAERAIENLNRLTNDLLDLEKLASGTIVLQLQATALMKVIDTAVADLSGFAEFRNVGIIIEGRDDFSVMADEQRLLQLCENLLSNAIKFSPEGSEVRVKIVKRDNQFIEVHFIDSGCGIASRNQLSIFEPFVQISDESGSRAQGGSGLGLAICRSIIEAHGGKISVQSELGKGSTFSVRLRCAINSVVHQV
ncbi:MAG: HAMP domain-containing histidine kinase [Candidatus Obscuribacterales bacterium]|nr:HAMP domain-containing histidine kinase [Candidatus Obscuribacterales bacterium]